MKKTSNTPNATKTVPNKTIKRILNPNLQSDSEKEPTIDEYRYLVAEYKKEISRLHKLNASKQVHHESEISKLCAELIEESKYPPAKPGALICEPLKAA